MKKKRGLVLGGILLLGIGFAAVSTTLYINGNVNIEANTEDFDVVFTKAVIDREDKTSTAISEDGKTITYTTKELQALNDKSVLDFEVKNNSSLYDAEVSIECTSGENGEYYQITKEVASTIPAKTVETGKIEVEKIKSTIEEVEEAFTCILTAVAKERTTKKEEPAKVNKNIVNTDEECYKDKSAGSCKSGTVIEYMVNDTEKMTFNVLHDDGDIMTLQQSENTVSSIPWNSSSDNTKGPLVALTSLETATSGWSNVNTINYEMGTTAFNGNTFTGCDYTSCTTNGYVLGNRSTKARMITAQEAAVVGCNGGNNSCPEWMHTSDYWTMSAYSDSLDLALYVSMLGGFLEEYNINYTNFGVRAVVEINKYI